MPIEWLWRLGSCPWAPKKLSCNGAVVQQDFWLSHLWGICIWALVFKNQFHLRVALCSKLTGRLFKCISSVAKMWQSNFHSWRFTRTNAIEEIFSTFELSMPINLLVCRERLVPIYVVGVLPGFTVTIQRFCKLPNFYLALCYIVLMIF